MIICVCVGSACHLNGSNEIIDQAKKLIEKNNLEEKVELKAAFCLGKCSTGVTIKIDEEIIPGVNRDNFEEIFNNKILKK